MHTPSRSQDIPQPQGNPHCCCYTWLEFGLNYRYTVWPIPKSYSLLKYNPISLQVTTSMGGNGKTKRISSSTLSVIQTHSSYNTHRWAHCLQNPCRGVQEAGKWHLALPAALVTASEITTFYKPLRTVNVLRCTCTPTIDHKFPAAFPGALPLH